MFFDASHIAVIADDRRRELLADAQLFRLAKLARAARRLVSATDPPTPIRPRQRARPDRPENSDADRRYAVSR